MAFTDLFERSENLTASADWDILSGTDETIFQCGSPSGAMGHAVVAGSFAAACPSQGSANHYSEAAIDGNALGWGFMLTIRMTDHNNFIGVYMNHADADFCLYKRVTSTFTKLGSYTVTPQAGDIIRVEASGDSIVAKYNGTSRISVTESFNNTELRQGFAAFATSGGNEYVYNFAADVTEAAPSFNAAWASAANTLIQPSGVTV